MGLSCHKIQATYVASIVYKHITKIPDNIKVDYQFELKH